MSERRGTQISIERTVIESFDDQFARLHARSCQLIEATPAEILYEDKRATKFEAASQSVGACVLRSAGAVEQTFGGITSNLWDDPFEWTLPETLPTPARVLEYLREVEETRKHAFASFAGDVDLLKEIATPSGGMRPLIHLLHETLMRALEYQGRAAVIQAGLSNTQPSGFII